MVGLAANVARAGEVAAVADCARDALGGCDLWINNAGTNAYSFRCVCVCFGGGGAACVCA